MTDDKLEAELDVAIGAARDALSWWEVAYARWQLDQLERDVFPVAVGRMAGALERLVEATVRYSDRVRARRKP